MVQLFLLLSQLSGTQECCTEQRHCNNTSDFLSITIQNSWCEKLPRLLINPLFFPLQNHMFFEMS